MGKIVGTGPTKEMGKTLCNASEIQVQVVGNLIREFRERNIYFRRF
jgi:hypothetical protein